MYKRILVPFDGSEFSEAALRHGAGLSEALGSHLTVLHVLDLPPQMKSLISYPLIKDQLGEVGEKIIRKAGEISSTFKISHEEKIAVGIPADEIIEETQEGQIDLIVIGSRGLGEVKGWLLGSVSQRVVRHSRCPVLVVK